jgi:nascent polypeptide-associated complex subunit alpha
MIPGGRVNPRQLKQMMKRMGIDADEMEGVEQVVITLRDRELVFSEPAVTKVRAQGQIQYQVLGEPIERKRAGAAAATERRAIPEEDVQLVAEKAGVPPERARKALEETGGDPAEAIIRLMSG